MTQRTMLILAATLTVFVIVLVGSVTAHIAAQSPVPPTPAATDAAAVLPAPQLGLDPTAVQALIGERAQVYQRQIREANERLQRANEQLEQAYQKQQALAAELDRAYKQQAPVQQEAPQPQVQDQPRPQSIAAPAPQPSAPTYAVSPDIAMAIALNSAPGATLTRQPELVDFQGIIAYEVLLDRGAVYVDANSGQVLYNAAAAAAPSMGHGEHEDGEHEDGKHEDGEHDD
jgi:uncharacterized membrane protein YkoI